MRTLIAADIHGVTAELRSLIEPIVSAAVYLSPWDGDACPFANEQEAASVFISQNGIESALGPFRAGSMFSSSAKARCRVGALSSSTGAAIGGHTQ